MIVLAFILLFLPLVALIFFSLVTCAVAMCRVIVGVIEIARESVEVMRNEGHQQD